MEVNQRVEQASLPKELKQYEKIEHGKDSGDRIIIYGIDYQSKKTRVKEDDFIKAFGHDPDEWQNAKDDWEAWITNNREGYLESRGLPALPSADFLENKQLRQELESEKLKNLDLQERLSNLEERLQRLEGRDKEFEDKRSWRDKINDFTRGRSLHIVYRTHPIRETIVESRDNRPRAALLAAGALALAGLVVWRYTGYDGISDEQAQALIEQNNDVLEALDPNGEAEGNALTEINDKISHLESIVDPNGSETDGDRLYDFSERLADVEGTIDPNGPEVEGDSFSQLDSRVDSLEDKMTKDHRELHGDIHPDPSLEPNKGEGLESGSEPDPGQKGEGSGGDASESGGRRTQTEILELKGDNIWSDVKGQLTAELGYEPTDSQISKATARVLEINGLSWEDARHLPVGYSYKVPTNLSSLIN